MTSAQIIYVYTNSQGDGKYVLSFFKLSTINTLRKLMSYYSWGKR